MSCLSTSYFTLYFTILWQYNSHYTLHLKSEHNEKIFTYLHLNTIRWAIFKERYIVRLQGIFEVLTLHTQCNISMSKYFFDQAMQCSTSLSITANEKYIDACSCVEFLMRIHSIIFLEWRNWGEQKLMLRNLYSLSMFSFPVRGHSNNTWHFKGGGFDEVSHKLFFLLNHLF